MKIVIELDIDIKEAEEPKMVLKHYFDHQSHLKGRQVYGFEILNNQQTEAEIEPEFTDSDVKKSRKKV